MRSESCIAPPADILIYRAFAIIYRVAHCCYLQRNPLIQDGMEETATEGKDLRTIGRCSFRKEQYGNPAPIGLGHGAIHRRVGGRSTSSHYIDCTCLFCYPSDARPI